MTLKQLIGNRYQVLSVLGSGGMGTVYRVRDRLNGRQQALKHIHYALDETPQHTQDDTPLRAYESLANEFEILASLRHPNIITVYDYGLHEGRYPFFTMELLDAPLDVKASGDQPFAVRLQWVLQALQALKYLHHCHILHGDIKPTNMLITNHQRVKLVDFGLAANFSQMMTAGGGTIAYSAPEILRKRQATPASDLYSLGLLALELLTGHFPYETRSLGKMMHQILNEPVRLDDTPLPDALRKVFTIWLAKDPAARYNDAHRVMVALCSASDQTMPQETLTLQTSYLRAARYVGRKREKALLTTALENARLGKGSAWLLGGVSGMGKSRLLDEVRIMALLKSFRVIRIDAPETSDPIIMLRDLLAALVPGTDLTPTEAGAIKTFIPEIDHWLGTSVETLPSLEGEANLQRLQQVTADIVRRQPDPLLVILEDIHRLGPNVTPIQAFARWLPTEDVVLIASYRTEEGVDLPEKLPALRRLTLEPLARQDVRQLIAHMLGSRNIGPAFVDQVAAYAEGNVFFIIDLLQTLAQNTDSLQDVGQLTLTDQQQVSPGVVEIARRRLSAVPVRYHDALYVAAVLGRQIDLNLLAHIDPQLAEDEQWLALCAARAIISRSGQTWQFAHDKIRAGLLENLPGQQRRNLHVIAARTIEGVYPDDDAYAEALMLHWRQADHIENETRWALRYAKHQTNTAFVRPVQTALADLLARLPDDFDPVQRAKVQRHLGHVLALTGDHDLARQHLDNSRAQAEGRDNETWAEALLGLAMVDNRLAQYEQAIGWARQAEAIYSALDDPRGMYGVMRALGNTYYRQMQLAQAEHYFQQAQDYARQWGNPAAIISSRGNSVIIYIWQNRFEEAETICLDLLAQAEAMQDIYSTARILNSLTLLYFRQGRLQEADHYTERAIEAARRVNDRALERAMLNNRASSATQQGDNIAAERYFQQAVDLARELNQPAGLALSLGAVAQVQVLLGKWDAVRESLREWATTLQTMGVYKAHLHGLYAAIDLALHDEVPQVAACWFGALLEHAIPSHRDPDEIERLRARIEALLPPNEIETAMQTGSQMTVETPIDQVQAYLIP